MKPRDVCPACAGEGTVDGLVVGDTVHTERCHACGGTGLPPDDDGLTAYDHLFI